MPAIFLALPASRMPAARAGRQAGAAPGGTAGERLKAVLACALWRAEPARLPLLDEPTNHHMDLGLDLDTTLMLQGALQGFEGALLVALHDEEFIAALRPTHRRQWQGSRLEMRECPGTVVTSNRRPAHHPGSPGPGNTGRGWSAFPPTLHDALKANSRRGQ
jgi:hypothetical protein